MRTARDAIDVRRLETQQLHQISPVGHQSPASGKEPQRVYRRQAMMVGQSYDFVAMNGGECVRKDKQTAIRFACQSIEDIIDVGWCIYVFSHYRPTPLVDCSFSADPLCWRGK